MKRGHSLPQAQFVSLLAPGPQGVHGGEEMVGYQDTQSKMTVTVGIEAGLEDDQVLDAIVW